MNIRRDWQFSMWKVNPILVAGGSGTRLRPLSRKSYTNQFSELIGEKTLFQSIAQRLISFDTSEFALQITLIKPDFCIIIGEQLQDIGIDRGLILIFQKHQPKN